jgi:enediyne biosynthesis protein E4
MRQVSSNQKNPAYILAAVILLLWGCKSGPKTQFELLSPEETGVEFANTISESDSFNIFTYDYIYNGGGVVAGDFNNDSLQDLFFSGNMVSNKLYLNKGDMKFRDVTDVARVGGQGKWCSGSVMVDINNDGWQDIYVCVTKSKDSLERANMLFVNKGLDENGIPVFEEEAEKWGIADKRYSIMAAFFDYDRDGDLDLYLLTNQQSEITPSNYRPKIVDGSAPNNDQLYRNEGNGSFSNVTISAGIVYEGFGLGLAISDFNDDGWPDIFVCNDFITNDLLYVNNQDGTFTNMSPKYLKHHSQSSMGVDAADFNNDGLSDLITMDMLPETNERKKVSISNKTYLNYINNEEFKYEYQYMRNMLQVNNGMADGIAFSEIGQMSGVFQTEWSWSSLFADFDNDGLKDVVITNGFPKDITDKDFVNYRTKVQAYVSFSDLLDSVPIVKIPNYAYRNNGDLTFTDVSKDWGFTAPSFSNGAVYADLDNDGDLDYVVNNINDAAFVYQNTLYASREKGDQATSHYIRFKLNGPPINVNAIGSKIKIFYGDGKMQFFEQFNSRGFLSSVENAVHAGLGNHTTVDSIELLWPDGTRQVVKNLKADQVVTIAYDAHAAVKSKATISSEDKIFKEVSEELNIRYKHLEQDWIDYYSQRTLPHKFSQQGPGLAVGDINNDGLEDFIIGSSQNFFPTYFTQQPDGKFKSGTIKNSATKLREDEGLLLFDADDDGDLDLYIVGGSLESERGSKDYQDVLFHNDGKGNFLEAENGLPSTLSSGSCVRAADFDRDGDLDLFVGGRVEPGSYPYAPESYLLKNEKGKFTNITKEACPELTNLGMITDGIFTDYDNDGQMDLIVVGEFLPITVLKNSNGKFKQLLSSELESRKGWWSSIVAGDFDKDGDSDYVVGNLGLNNAFQVTKEFPLKIFAKDFDGNASVDAILACHVKESLQNPDRKNLYPVHFWDELNSQSPRFRRQFTKYKQYGRATVNDIFTEAELKDALILEANYFQTSYIENMGSGNFKIVPFSNELQISVVNGMVVDDVNNDGNLDVLMVGNDFGNEVFAGRYDAFTGAVLLGDGKGGFKSNQSNKTGFYVPGDSKGLAKLSRKSGDVYIATVNQDSIKVFATLKPLDGYTLQPLNSETYAEIIDMDGKKQKVEFYFGSGYLSQSTRSLRVNRKVKEVIYYNSKGVARKVNVLAMVKSK